MPNVTAVTGCFDVPHIGHLHLIEFAKSLGRPVVLGINSDSSISQLKGPDRPWYPQFDRRELWGALRDVQSVYIVDNPTMREFLLWIKPRAWVKGGDWGLGNLDNGELEACKKIGCQIVFFQRVPGVSTTDVIKQMVNSAYKRHEYHPPLDLIPQKQSQ